MKYFFFSPLLLILSWMGVASAQDTNTMAKPDPRAEIVSKLDWKTGLITLPGDKAKLNLPADFRFLSSADANRVLENVWGNPPDHSVLGMIFPADRGPLDHSGYGVIVSYESNGHVKDDDESKINYDDLLKQMQKEVDEENPKRKEAGYPTVQLLGWATPPHYDKESHKLYWAKKLLFEGETTPTLNYDVRILGRTGVLVLSTVAGLDQFDEISGKNPEILGTVDFNQGSRYADFDPTTDRVAEYGIAALVAGGALAGAAKLGLFGILAKYSIVALIALKKFAIIAIVAVGAALRQGWAWFSGRKKVVMPTNRQP